MNRAERRALERDMRQEVKRLRAKALALPKLSTSRVRIFLGCVAAAWKDGTFGWLRVGCAGMVRPVRTVERLLGSMAAGRGTTPGVNALVKLLKVA